MNTILLALLTAFLFHGSAHAADKIRIVLPNVSGTFMTFPLAQKRGFLKEERLDAEIIRVTGRASSTALSNGEVDYGTGINYQDPRIRDTYQSSGLLCAGSC